MFSFKQFLTESKESKVLLVSFHFEQFNIEAILRKKINATIVTCKWSDITITDKKAFAKNIALDDFGFVFFGITGEDIKVANSVYSYCAQHKIPTLKYGNILGDKMKQTVEFSNHKIPQIKTIVADESNISASKLISELGLPVIAKAHSSAKGKSVKKFETKIELETFLKTLKDKGHWIFQQFIENDGDYRLFFIKNKLVYSIKRTRKSNGKEFRNNTSLGADSEFVDDLPKEAILLATLAHKKLGFDFSGVDLIFDSAAKKWLVIEVNIAPQFNSDPKKIELVTDEVAKIISSKL